jgi:hypothetical protein
LQLKARKSEHYKMVKQFHGMIQFFVGLAAHPRLSLT